LRPITIVFPFFLFDYILYFKSDSIPLLDWRNFRTIIIVPSIFYSKIILKLIPENSLNPWVESIHNVFIAPYLVSISRGEIAERKLYHNNQWISRSGVMLSIYLFNVRNLKTNFTCKSKHPITARSKDYHFIKLFFIFLIFLIVGQILNGMFDGSDSSYYI